MLILYLDNYTMKNSAVIFILLLFFSVDLAAQTDRNREVFPSQVSIDHNDAVRSFSQDFVTAFTTGSLQFDEGARTANHIAIINQFGTGNTALLEQYGLSNMASINMFGNFNFASLIQDGINNVSNIHLIGDHNRITGLQIGESNRLDILFEGSGFDRRFEQIGDNHSIEMTGEGIPLSITQTGNGTNLIIENN
jgi:hypothetical protein